MACCAAAGWYPLRVEPWTPNAEPPPLKALAPVTCSRSLARSIHCSTCFGFPSSQSRWPTVSLWSGVGRGTVARRGVRVWQGGSGAGRKAGGAGWRQLAVGDDHNAQGWGRCTGRCAGPGAGAACCSCYTYNTPLMRSLVALRCAAASQWQRGRGLGLPFSKGRRWWCCLQGRVVCCTSARFPTTRSGLGGCRQLAHIMHDERLQRHVYTRA